MEELSICIAKKRNRLPRCLSGNKKIPPTSAGDAGNTVSPLGQEDPLEEEMVNSSLLTCIIPRTEEPDGLQKMGSQRVGQDSATQRTSKRSQSEKATYCRTPTT